MDKLQHPVVMGDRTGLSRVLAWACLGLAVLLPVVALFSMVQSSPAEMLAKLGIRLPLGANPKDLPIAAWQHGLAVCISLLPVSAMAYGLLRAGQCLLGVARGEVFSLDTVQHLRGFAAGLLAASSIGLFAPTLIVFLLTWYAPVGGRVLTMSLGSHQLLMLLFSGIVWQMGYAMARAVEIAEDNAQII